VSSDHGVAGPLDTHPWLAPDGRTVPIVWVGLGGAGDDVLIALDDGTLLATSDVASLARTAAPRVGAVPGATTWASAPGIVAAAVGNTVWASTDGGHTFHSSVVGAGLTVVSLFARYDGALVAQVSDKNAGAEPTQRTYLGRADGAWQPSPYNVYALVQTGSWIAVSRQRGCPGALLAADGRHFVREPSLAIDDLPELLELLSFEHATTLVLPQSYVTASTPPPPAFDPAQEVTSDDQCLLSGSSSSWSGGRVGYKDKDPLRFVRGGARPTPTTASELALVRDSACVPDATNKGLCVNGAPLRRQPHVIMWNHASDEVHVEDAPPGCVPAQADSLRGLDLLRCDAGASTAVWTLERQNWAGGGHWVTEGSIAVANGEIQSADQADDGTLVLSACGSQPCRAFVRAPAKLGDATAWRELAPGDVFRALRGGAALVITEDAKVGTRDPSGRQSIRVSVYVDRPGEARKMLGSNIQIDDDVRGVTVRDGRVILELDRELRATPAP
jgi:hypothetical protein